jgi:ubiquinone biosynthesis protein COQ4
MKRARKLLSTSGVSNAVQGARLFRSSAASSAWYDGVRNLNRPSLYEGHVPTSTSQKAVLTVYSAVAALVDPKRADLVAVLGETTGHLALLRMRDKMASDPVGAGILLRRPRITEETVNLTHLRTMDTGSFGRSYAEFMDGHGYSPDARPNVRFVEDEELAYVMARYRLALFHKILDFSKASSSS